MQSYKIFILLESNCQKHCLHDVSSTTACVYNYALYLLTIKAFTYCDILGASSEQVFDIISASKHDPQVKLRVQRYLG